MTSTSTRQPTLPPELWDINRLAEYLGVSKNSVYHLTRNHRIAFIQVGKELRFDPRDVAEYLDREHVAANPDQPRLPRYPGRPRKVARPVVPRDRSRGFDPNPATGRVFS